MIIALSPKDIEFEFHHSNKGLILGFSMTGDKIGSFNSSQWDEFTNNQNIICRLHVSIGANYQWETTDGSYIMCPIKTILASPRGERLSFTNYQDVAGYSDVIWLNKNDKLFIKQCV